MKVRLADIAERADVSEATVSRVLNGRPGVQETTRRAVLRIAAEMGRSVPGAARTADDLVGIVLPDLRNPAFSLMASALESELHVRSLRSLLVSHARSEAEEAVMIDDLIACGVRGLVVVSGYHANVTATKRHYARILAAGVRPVLVNGVFDGLDAPFVSTDDAAAVRLAHQHLRELGHARIGLAVGEAFTVPVREKIAAFEALVREAEGPDARPLVGSTVFSPEGGFQAAQDLAREGATGIVCASDVMALGAVEGLRHLGLRVPDDVSVVGFDDIPLVKYSDPPLTTVRQATGTIARTAVHVLDNALRGGDAGGRSVFTVAPELVVRGSTASAR
jgi:DNA-binding LacI/PurR family transcriptional regulator